MEQPIEAEQITQPITAEQTVQPIKDEEAPFVLDEDVMPVAETLPATHSPAVHTAPEPAMPEAPSSIATTLAAASATLTTPVAAAEQTFVFEPYHTIDYFASQGIKLDKIDPIPQDKLGRQLKSFTEWLKSMKKLPQVSIEKALAENEESAVVAAASHSIEGKEVITEAMAEVYEKQGLHDKAADIYRKLSLLNPAKSAYFADRINALKQ